jgi:hypothetical protein
LAEWLAFQSLFDFCPTMIALPYCYFGNLSFFSLLVQNQAVLETQENFIKQTYRNRCEIGTSLGKENLIVPIRHKDQKTPMHAVEIAYEEDWQKWHLRALVTAYRRSPFFEHYAESLFDLFQEKPKYLIDLNKRTLLWALQTLSVSPSFSESVAYLPSSQYTADYRTALSPKKPSIFQKTYQQVFSDKQDFLHDLSILDAIFCLGAKSTRQLIQKS